MKYRGFIFVLFMINISCGAEDTSIVQDAGTGDLARIKDSASRFALPFGEYLLRMTSGGGCPESAPKGVELFNDLKVFQAASNPVVPDDNENLRYRATFIFGNQMFQDVEIRGDKKFYTAFFQGFSALISFEGQFSNDWSFIQFELLFTYYLESDDRIAVDCKSVWIGWAQKISEYPLMLFSDASGASKRD